jgi:uncharacterized protein YggT (Ycf19 family)
VADPVRQWLALAVELAYWSLWVIVVVHVIVSVCFQYVRPEKTRWIRWKPVRFLDEVGIRMLRPVRRVLDRVKGLPPVDVSAALVLMLASAIRSLILSAIWPRGH